MTSKNSSSTFLPQASSIIDNSSCILGLRLARPHPRSKKPRHKVVTSSEPRPKPPKHLP